MTRLNRNNPNPSKICSLEAIAGIQRSKNSPAKHQATSATATMKKEAAKTEEKPQLKKNLMIRQTATSMKRATMTTGSFKPREVFTARPAPNINKKPEVPQVKSLKVNPKLTMPRSPSFTHRAPRPAPSTQKPITTSKNSGPAKPVPKTEQKKVANQTPRKTETVPEVKSTRKSSSWMIPLTPEKAITVVDGAKNSPRTPKVKPFIRKSFSETKVTRKSVAPLNRTLNPMPAPKPTSLVRRSVSVSTLNSSRSSVRSSWMFQKEPSEKYFFKQFRFPAENFNDFGTFREKIQHWLEKRGRSIASCRHLGCLGHKLEDFTVPQRQSSARKSVMVIRSKVTEEAGSASPQLKVSANLRQRFDI